VDDVVAPQYRDREAALRGWMWFRSREGSAEGKEGEIS